LDPSLAARIAGGLLGAYLLGGVPWALVIGQGIYQVDVRRAGSGNLGATNVMRVLGWKAALATFLLDVAKGALAVLLAAFLVSVAMYGHQAHEWAMLLATLAAIAGHAFSPYIRFRGGKGVATAAGALLVLVPLAWLFLLVTWLAVVAVWRMVSLGSVVIAVEFPLLVAWLYPADWPLLGFAIAAGAFVIWRHSANIRRILAGQESTISFRRSSAGEQKDEAR
jgi:glycerol-3-phosphate acyltransferase PlsY